MTRERDGYRSGFVTLVGRPNVGKSTLMNRLIGQKIAITSAKPQTTRGQIRTIYTDERAQIVFIDTPGLHIAKNKLGDHMVRMSRGALQDVDAVLLMTEPAREIGDIEAELIAHLKKASVPAMIIVNKADLYDEALVAHTLELYAGQAPFAKAMALSALRGEGTDALMTEIIGMLPYGEALYDEDELTDQPVRDIAAEIIREKALRLLNDEVPHGVAVTVEKMRERTTRAGEPITDIEASIICEKDTHKGIVIGKGGRMLKQIGTLARGDIERLTEGKVNLRLFVKVRKDWRNDALQLKSLGYR